MRKISSEVKNKILRKTPWGHSSSPHDEGLNEEQIKGLFYKAITDEENSVISEINRIVEEGNKQFSEIDNTEYFGKIENELYSELGQNWVRSGNFVYVCGQITPQSEKQVEMLSGFYTNVASAKNLYVRITAPEGIIPDSSLTLTIGDKSFSGLELLRNTEDEATNGIYYIRIAIPVNKIRKESVSIKWSAESNKETVLFDFSDDYSQSTEKQLFIKFASSIDGKDMSSMWNNGLNYIGFYYSDVDGEADKYKWARLTPPACTWTSYTLSVSSWNTDKKATINLSTINENSIVVVEPIYSSYTQWQESKIRLMTQSIGTLTLVCDTIPDSEVQFRVLVGNQEN